jgi:hypothetical protein
MVNELLLQFLSHRQQRTRSRLGVAGKIEIHESWRESNKTTQKRLNHLGVAPLHININGHGQLVLEQTTLARTTTSNTTNSAIDFFVTTSTILHRPTVVATS